jgi:large subunit ribosomal protein L25
MSGTDISLKVEERTVVGKGVRQLRRDGMTPAVIHDHGKASHHIMAPSIAIDKVYQSAGKHHPVNLTLGTKKFMALIKDVAFEPRKHTITHIVFNAISAKEKQQTEVPVHLSEDIPAEKAGYLVIRQLDAVEIEALPKDLIDEIVLDASSLAEIGDKLTVADISVPTGVTIITAADHPIAVVEETKAQMSEEETTEETAEESSEEIKTNETSTEESSDKAS